MYVNQCRDDHLKLQSVIFEIINHYHIYLYGMQRMDTNAVHHFMK